MYTERLLCLVTLLLFVIVNAIVGTVHYYSGDVTGGILSIIVTTGLSVMLIAIAMGGRDE